MNGKVVRVYSLTPKAYRYVWAIEAYEEKFRELEKLTDEEILKMVEDKKKEVS